MRIGVLGTGMVGRAIAGRLAGQGHEVVVGTRDVASTTARTEPDARGIPAYQTWAADHPGVKLGTFADAAGHGELVVVATQGEAALPALAAAGGHNLAGKVLLDISNPLDFSHEMPPTLLVKDTDSLGEQIQRAYPDARVVKALNTLTADLMINPSQLAGGDHSVFVAGNDAGAKAAVVELLRGFGWQDVIDVGDISSARGTEMYLPLWLRLMGSLGTAAFNIKVVR
jgi:predicted dinucleotide-binding enzyme